MSPLVLAIDIATSTGIAIGRVGEKPTLFTVNFGRDADMIMRVGKATLWAAEFLRLNRPDAIFIEAPMPPNASKNADATMTALTLFGAIAGPCHAKFRNVQTAHVQSVRSKFLGIARPDDPKSCAMRLCEALGWTPSNTDEADAAALWWFAGLRLAPQKVQIITPMMQQKAVGGALRLPKGALI